MATQLSIFNAAVSHCGVRNKIQSTTEQSREALACMTHWDIVRAAALRRYDWNFARVTAQLTQITCTVQRWQYEFVIPANCLRIRTLNDIPVPSSQQWFEMAADVDATGAPINVIFCNLNVNGYQNPLGNSSTPPPLAAVYTLNHNDPSRWDASFVDAMALLLAAAICYELSAKEDRAVELAKHAEMALQIAAAQCANENPSPAPTYVAESLQARGYHDGQGETGQAWPGGDSWPDWRP